MDIEQFVDQLIAEKGIETEDTEVAAQIREDLMERVENRIQTMIMEHMPEDKLEEFEQKLDSASDEDIQAYLQTTIPDFDEKVGEELLAFKTIYLG